MNADGRVVYNGVWRNGLIEVEEGMWFDYVSQQHCGLYADGNKKYEGDMVHGIPEGVGVYYDQDGVMLYIGSWKNGYYQIDSSTTWFSYRSETQCLLYDNGNVKYAGAVTNGLPEGFGKYYDRDGNVKYEGEWTNGLIEVSDCTRYDITSEHFIVYYADGCKKYEGKMNDGVPEGEGVYYSEDGIMKYSGIWRNGLIKVEEGMWFDYSTDKLCGLYADGRKKYEGEMNNGLPDGYGVYYDQNGNVKYEGYWVDGEIHLNGNKWFCYENEIIVIKKTFVDRCKESVKAVMKWMKTKTGTVVISVVIAFSLIMVLLIMMILDIIP